MLCVVHHVSAFETDMASSLKTKWENAAGEGHEGTSNNENGAARGSASDFKKPAHAFTPVSAILHRLLK